MQAGRPCPCTAAPIVQTPKSKIHRSLIAGILILPMAALTDTSYADELLGTRLLGKCDNGYLYLLERVDRQREALKNKYSYSYETCMVRANDPEPCVELWNLQYGPRESAISKSGGLDNISIAERQNQRLAKESQIRQSKGVRLNPLSGFAQKDEWGCDVLRNFQRMNRTGCQGRLNYVEPHIDIEQKCMQEQHVQNTTSAEKLKKARLTAQCQGLKGKFEALKEQDSAPAAIERAHITAAADMYGCGNLGEDW